MKFIRTRNEFLNEAVRVETNRYERSHGKKPRGYGQWAFYFDDKGGEPIFTPKAMSYSDAVKWAKGEAKKAGKEYIYVGESLNEGVKGYSPAERMEMAKKGLALDDGSFPIRNLNDLKNAIMAYGRAKDQAKAAKFIAKRAKALNAEDLIPDTEDFQKALKESVVTEAVKEVVISNRILNFLEERGVIKASDSQKIHKDLTSFLKKNLNESVVTEAFIGPFVFNDKMSDEELLGMYNGALDGYANYAKGFQHSKSDYKRAYQEIEKILKKRGVSVDESVINEAGVNDPVLMAFRAAKMKREKELAKPKRRPLYGKERMKAEDDLWQISQDLKDLYADRGQMLIDMEQEAEAEGGPIADEYGGKLNDIEDQIQKLLAKRSKLEIRLAESKAPK